MTFLLSFVKIFWTDIEILRIDKGDKHACYNGKFYTKCVAVSLRVYCLRVFGYEFVGFMLFIQESMLSKLILTQIVFILSVYV